MTADFKRELLSIATEGGWLTEEEARSLIRSVRAETPETLPDAIGAVIEWARDIKMQQTMLETVLTGGVLTRLDVDGEISLSLSVVQP